MIQEYLFISNEKRTEIEEYRPEKVTVEIYEIDNSECWIATYSVQGEKEESANILSKVNKHIIDKYHPSVLINGCAAYYNKTLYPLINEFERKLRKLLYLKSALNKNDIASKNIQDLESKDLGEIFTLLFTDDQFVKNVRATVNSKTWQFSRQEILSTIERITENTTWDHLLGTESVPALRQQFLTVKDYRNDVMHAHDIEAKMFRDAKKVFEQVNNQLDSEIRKIIDIAESNPEETKKSDYNSDLSSALERHANAFLGLSPVPIANNLTAVPAIPLSGINNSLDTPDILSRQRELQSILADSKAIKIDTQLHGLSSQIEAVSANLQGLTNNIPTLMQYQDIASKIDIPAIVHYQEIASKIDIPTITEALKFQNEFQSIVNSNISELQHAAKLSAEISPAFPEIQKVAISQHPDPSMSLSEDG